MNEVDEKEETKEVKKRKPLTDEQRVRKNASARADRKVEADKGLQAIIVELAVGNASLDRIDTNIKMFKDLAAASYDKGEKVAGQTLANDVDMLMYLNQISNQMKSLLGDTTWIRGKSSQIAEYTDEMVDSLNWLSKFFSGSKLQAAEDRKEFLELLRALRAQRDGSLTARQARVANNSGGKGMGLADAAAGAGLLEKLISGAIKTAIGTGGLIAGFIAGVVGSISELFMTLGKGVASLIKRMFGGGKLGKIGIAIEEFFVGIKVGLSRLLKPLEPIIATVKNGAKLIGENTKGFFSVFDDIIKWIGEIARPFFKIGKILGKLAVPITVIMGAYDTLVAAFKAYEDGASFGDILKSSITGLINSLISGPLDLIKNAGAWILDKFGATDIAEGLKGWDFADWVSEIIDRVVTWGRNLFSKIFQTIFDMIENATSGFKDGPLAGIGKALQTMVHYLISKPMQFVIDQIAAMVAKIPLFGEKASKWIKDNVNVEKLTGGGLKETEAPEFKTKNGDMSITDAVIKRHDDKKLEDETKKRLELSPQAQEAGATMKALQDETNDLNNAPDIYTHPSEEPAPAKGASVTNNASNITYNAGGLFDRTDMLLRPPSGAASWQ